MTAATHYTVTSKGNNTSSRLTYVCLSVRPSVTLCTVAKRCVLEQKLLLTAYRKSYMRNWLVPLNISETV